MTNFELEDGTVIYNIHNPINCTGRPCTIHNPTKHDYSDLPRTFKMGHMERRLDDGTFVLDPDEAAFMDTNVIRNSFQCLECGDHIQSRHRHHFVGCQCGNVFTDGGYSYVRMGCRDASRIKSTCIYI